MFKILIAKIKNNQPFWWLKIIGISLGLVILGQTVVLQSQPAFAARTGIDVIKDNPLNKLPIGCRQGWKLPLLEGYSWETYLRKFRAGEICSIWFINKIIIIENKQCCCQYWGKCPIPDDQVCTANKKIERERLEKEWVGVFNKWHKDATKLCTGNEKCIKNIGEPAENKCVTQKSIFPWVKEKTVCSWSGGCPDKYQEYLIYKSITNPPPFSRPSGSTIYCPGTMEEYVNYRMKYFDCLKK